MSDYNGWPNYETWAMNLWITNDENFYMYGLELAETALADAEATDTWTKEESARFNLADALKDWQEESRPELDASVWSDYLNASLAKVDWHEIACNYLETIIPELAADGAHDHNA